MTDCPECPTTDCPVRAQLEFELAAARTALAAVREVAAARRVIGPNACSEWENGNAASTANEAARTTAAKRSRPGLTPIPNTSRNGG